MLWDGVVVVCTYNAVGRLTPAAVSKNPLFLLWWRDIRRYTEIGRVGASQE